MLAAEPGQWCSPAMTGKDQIPEGTDMPFGGDPEGPTESYLQGELGQECGLGE